jgi:hypothetical protein
VSYVNLSNSGASWVIYCSRDVSDASTSDDDKLGDGFGDGDGTGASLSDVLDLETSDNE